MNIFVYKTLFVFFVLFLLFNLTIGYQIRKIENKISNINPGDELEFLKTKIKEELKSGIKKDKIFEEEDRVLIRDFLKKVILELELNKK